MLTITLLSIATTVLGLGVNPVVSCDTERLSADVADDSAAGILKMLREGETQIRLEEKDRDMVVIMGITGSGKTTFVLHIGGYGDDLTSVETVPFSGDFIVDDRRKRISNASTTLESCTLIPTSLVDRRTQKTLVDMPGFSDTRPSVVYDIAATYFMKKVLDYARRVKLVFLVNHSHVRVGEDRGRFTELVGHITTLVRNVSKFEDGIALVATKVANTYRYGNGSADSPYVADDVVIAGIADFLRGARSFYSKNNQTKATRLMDILLRKKNNNRFDRIGVFRKPDMPGPLKDVTLLQKNKRGLEALVESGLRYVDKSDVDFGYTLSEKSKNILHKMRDEMLRNVSAQIKALGGRIEAHFNDRQASATELEALIAIFNDSSVEVSAFKSMADFADYLHKYTEERGVSVAASALDLLRDAEKHFDFLTYISGEAPVDWSSTIREGMKETVQYLQHSRTWYVLFLGALYDQFAGYEVQTLQPKYESLSKQINRFQSGTTKKVALARLDALKSLLVNVNNQHLLRIFASMEEADVTKRNLHFLQTLLEVTLGDPKTKIWCKEDQLIAEGRYVLVSDVVKKRQTCHGKPIHHVRIFALEKVFVDTNVNFTGTEVHQFTVVAPVWEVRARVEISLNGAVGRPSDRPAPAGEHWSEDGHDGKAGAPGSSAAHFVGIGAHFINGEHLTITSIGGTGGSGQKGGHGRRGEDGREARKYNGDGGVNWDAIWPGHKYEQNLLSEPGFFESTLYYVFITSKEYVYSVEVYSLDPSRGGRGGHGGNGGRGGRGGHGGKIILLNLDSHRNSSVKCIANDGHHGEAGEGGRGGVGGLMGRTLVEINRRTKSLFGSEKNTLNFEKYIPAPSELRWNGRDGQSGGNDKGIESPTAVPFKKPYNLVNEYKVFVKKYARTSQTRVQKQFLNKLDHDVTVASL